MFVFKVSVKYIVSPPITNAMTQLETFNVHQIGLLTKKIRNNGLDLDGTRKTTVLQSSKAKHKDTSYYTKIKPTCYTPS